MGRVTVKRGVREGLAGSWHLNRGCEERGVRSVDAEEECPCRGRSRGALEDSRRPETWAVSWGEGG